MLDWLNPLRWFPDSSDPREIRILVVGLVLSGLCSVFFAIDIIGDLFLDGQFPNEETHLTIEFLVVAISFAVLVFHVRELNRLFRRHRRVSDQVRVASGEFATVIEALFEDWQLTPAERDVAILLIKGLSFGEIGEARSAREGTVKAQSNAIYRKAGVAGRHELLAFFLDELLQGVPVSDNSQT